MQKMFRVSMLVMALCLMFPGLAGAADMEGFGFMLTGIDGDLLGGEQPDRFRIKIWDPDSGVIVYDNQRDNVFGGYLQLGSDFNDYLGAELRIGTTAKGSNAYGGGTVDLSADSLFSYLLKLQY